MKKSHKGDHIEMIEFYTKTGFVQVINKDGSTIKTTREQRNLITKYIKDKTTLVANIRKAFNNPNIIDDDVYIKIVNE